MKRFIGCVTVPKLMPAFNATALASHTWAGQLGSSDHDESPGAAVDRGGNAYTTGTSIGDLVVIEVAGYDLFLAKYTP